MNQGVVFNNTNYELNNLVSDVDSGIRYADKRFNRFFI